MITDPQFTTNSIVIDSGGMLEITPSEFTLDCDVVFQLDASGSALIKADEDIVLHPDSTLELIATGPSPFKAGTYTLIEAQGIDGTFGGLGVYATTRPDGNGLTYASGPAALTVTIDKDLNPGDANLDAVTDVRDFNLWNAHKFTGGTEWATGDFTGDGETDIRDFNKWNAAKFTSATGGAALVESQVPEPTTLTLLGLGVLLLAGYGCRRRWRPVA